MSNCAVCRLSDGLVLNVIVASPDDLAPDGCQLVELADDALCNTGWYYAGGVFHGPRTFAMCEAATGAVVSFFSASYVSPVPTAPDGYFGVEVTQEMYCDIGWTWDGAQFHPPVG